jgi:hypothetical protein
VNGNVLVIFLTDKVAIRCFWYGGWLAKLQFAFAKTTAVPK